MLCGNQGRLEKIKKSKKNAGPGLDAKPKLIRALGALPPMGAAAWGGRVWAVRGLAGVTAAVAAVRVLERSLVTSLDIVEAHYRRIGHLQIVESEETLFKSASNSGPVYGAITYYGVRQMLSAVETNGKSFYDLGSGIARGIISAAKEFPELRNLVGVELSPSRHALALAAVDTLCTARERAKISLQQMSMLNLDLKGADIVFVSSLCFEPEFLEELSIHLDQSLRAGATVLSSKPLFMDRATYDGKVIVEMTWNDKHALRRYTIWRDKSTARSNRRVVDAERQRRDWLRRVEMAARAVRRDIASKSSRVYDHILEQMATKPTLVVLRRSGRI